MCAPGDPWSRALQKNDPFARRLGITDALDKGSKVLDPIGAKVGEKDPIYNKGSALKHAPAPVQNVYWTPPAARVAAPSTPKSRSRLTIGRLQ